MSIVVDAVLEARYAAAGAENPSKQTERIDKRVEGAGLLMGAS